MKYRISGRFTPRALSTAMLASALGIASAFSGTAQADTTAVTCNRLTPEEIGKVQIALDLAQTTADATTTLAGYDPSSPSAYPNAEIRYAKTVWQTELDYLATMPVDYVQPYLFPGNVALSFEQASIDMAYFLQHGRYWATAMAYHYSVVNPPLAQRYIETRRDIAAAINAMQLIANLGSRCAAGQVSVSPDLPNP